MMKRLAEVEAEEKELDKREREQKLLEAKRAKKLAENRARRERLLAMGISEEDMRGIGLLEGEDDDPSWCKQAHNLWMASAAREWICSRIEQCCTKAKVEPEPDPDEKYIKGGATRHKCGHVCLLWQQRKCCWCSDRRPVIEPEKNIEVEGKLIGLDKELDPQDPDDAESDGIQRLYPGYQDGFGWKPKRVTRDFKYCRVCQHLGQDGRNLAAILAEENSKDAEYRRLQEEADNAAARKADEERKLREAEELIKRLEEGKAAVSSGQENARSGGDNDLDVDNRLLKDGNQHNPDPENAEVAPDKDRENS